jgi:hypothetical protein
VKRKGKASDQERVKKAVEAGGLFKEAEGFLPRSPNSHKSSISNSNRLKMSQASGVVSRNTTPVGFK